MAKKKISDLPAGSALTGIELVPIVQSGTTKRITAQDIADLSNASSIGGGGTANYVSKFTTEFNIGDSQIFDNGTSVGISTDTPNASYKLDVNGSLKATSIVKSGGTSAEYLKADGSVSTLTNPITGTGTTNYLPKFTGSTSLGDSIISDNGTIATIAGNTTILKNQNGITGLTAQNNNLTNGAGQGLSFNFDGATNLGGIFHTYNSALDAYNLSFNAWDGTSSLTRLFINGDNGLVGIGTSSPSSLLQLEGATPVFTINKTSGTSLGANFKSSGTSVAELTANTSSGEFKISSGFSSYGGFLTFNTDGSERMRIFSDGNIGINTSTNAGYKLDINGTARVKGTSAGLTIQSTSAGQNAELFFTSTATTWRIGQNIGTATDFEIYNGSTKFKMNTTGVVTLNNGTTNQNTRIFDNKIGMSRTSDGAEVVYFSKNTDLGTEGTANINGYDGIQFRTQGAESVKAVITSAGNFGLGTSSPSQKLHLYTASASSIYTRIENANGNTYLGLSAGGDTILSADTAGNKLLLYTAATERMRITSGGNVLIGTTTDNGATFQVNGSGTFANTLSITSILRVKSSAYPNTYNTSLRSDSSAIGILQLGNNNDNYILAGNTGTGGYLIFRVNCSSESIYSGSEAMRITSDGQLAVGTTSPDASALVQIDSSTQGFLVPRMLESEINSISSPAEGLMVYNTDQKHMCMYDGSGWKKFSMSNM